MSISMNRINAIINERFSADVNGIVTISPDIVFKHDEKKSVSKELKQFFPDEYIKLTDKIFDELHPY